MGRHRARPAGEILPPDRRGGGAPGGGGRRMGTVQRRRRGGAPAGLTMDERFVRPSVEREIDDEMAFHLEMRVRELVAGGMSEEDARAEALRRAGNLNRIKARMRHEAR